MSLDYPSVARKAKSARPVPSIPRPIPLSPKFDVIERHLGELAELPSWVCWKYDWDGKRWTKPPYQIIGRKASPTNGQSWSSFDACRSACLSNRFGYDGVGFVFDKSYGLIGIDLDDCIDRDGLIEPWAVRALGVLGLGEQDYVELSPSGGGLRTFVRGELPWDVGGRRRGQVEVYAHQRFLTITGHRLNWGGR